MAEGRGTPEASPPPPQGGKSPGGSLASLQTACGWVARSPGAPDVATVNLGQGGAGGEGRRGRLAESRGTPRGLAPPPRSRQSPGGSLASLWASGVRVVREKH